MKYRLILLISMFPLIAFEVSKAQVEESLGAISILRKGQERQVSDLSGNDNHGKLEGNTGWAEGKFGKAVKFGGKNGIVRVEHSKDFEFVDGITLRLGSGQLERRP